MWVLLFVLLLGVVVALWFLMTLRDQTSAYTHMSAADMARTAAQQTLQIMSVCQGKSPGTYTTTQLMGTNFPATLPAGAHWVCQVSVGGTDANGTTAALYTDGPPTNWTTYGNKAQQAGGAALQSVYAWEVASDIATLARGTMGTVAGVVDAQDPKPLLHPVSGSEIDLTGRMPANLAYSTPVLVSGAVAPAL